MRTICENASTLVPSINEEWNVSSDVFNLSCVWALHRLVTSNNQSKLVKQVQIDVGVILQFKYYTSIWYNFFDKPVDKAAAEATYQALSLKFRLRQLGSWGALMEYQAAQLIDPKGCTCYCTEDICGRQRRHCHRH